VQLLEIKYMTLCATALLFEIQICLASNTCELNNLEACTASNHERAEAALNSQYKKSMSSLSGHFKESLKSAETSWIEYRRDICGSLNSLDSLGCESSLADQRTQELYLIERKIGVGVAHGVVDFISKEFGSETGSSLLARIVARQPQSESWNLYSENHCGMMRKLAGENIDYCKIRLILNNWEGF
jgi:uncharacterized protein YecT (DUF1311 family)